MSNGLTFGRDSHNNCAYTPIPSTDKYTATITNGNETHTTLPTSPTGYWHVNFRYYPAGSSVWVDVSGGTAAVPAGNTLASSTSEGNPAGFLLPSGAKISMITSVTSVDVSVVLWMSGQYQ